MLLGSAHLENAHEVGDAFEVLLALVAKVTPAVILVAFIVIAFWLRVSTMTARF
jgi:hypothetical protein